MLPRAGRPRRSAGGTPALRAWNAAAAEAAWDAGCREYHFVLRPFAMAVWLDWKPDALKRRRTHGVWVPPGHPERTDKLTPEEFEQLPVEERIAVLREHRPGYWSKLGPQSSPRIG